MMRWTSGLCLALIMMSAAQAQDGQCRAMAHRELGKVDQQYALQKQQCGQQHLGEDNLFYAEFSDYQFCVQQAYSLKQTAYREVRGNYERCTTVGGR